MTSSPHNEQLQRTVTRRRWTAQQAAAETAASCVTIEVRVSPKEAQPDPALSQEESARVAALSDAEIRDIDAALLAEASSKWRKVARVVGGAMSHQPSRIAGIPDLFYAQRVRQLVANGLLEAAGDLRFIGRSEVRLPLGRVAR